MRKVLMTTAAVLGLGGSALAADLPVKAYAPMPVPYTWTGWYIGGYMGDGFSSFPLGFGSNNATLAALSPGAIGPANSALLAGGMIGGQYQVGSLVFGAELQGGFTGFNSNASGIAGITQSQSSVPWDIAILARVGITPTPRVLLYAVGGGEGAEIDHSTTLNLACGTVTGSCTASDSNVHFGFTVGAGVEWAPEVVAPFRLGMEYRYVDVGTSAVNLAVANTPIVMNSSDTARWNQVVFRAIYPFNSPL